MTSLAPTVLRSLPSLEELDLSGTSIGPEGLRLLRHLPSLVALSLMCNRGDATETRAISEVTQLRHLRLRGPLLDDEGMASITVLRQLESLDLCAGPGLGDRGLGQLRELPRLRRLTVLGSRHSDDGMAVLGKIATLESVRITGGSITDAGIGALVKLPSLRSLSVLYAPGVTNSAIAGLLRCERLEEVSLEGAGISRIRELAKLPRLRVLDVRNTAVTAEEVDAFQRMRPAVRVRWTVGQDGPSSVER